MPEVILYGSIASRTLGAFWMLEELAIPYEWRETDIKARQHKTPEYLAINPSGRVPALSIDGAIVTERPAIYAILADRFSYGAMAPKLEEAARGPYYKWLVYAGAVLDPALSLAISGEPPLRDKTWNALPDVIAELDGALAGKSFILGETFTAADVALGAVLAAASYSKSLPDKPNVAAYIARLMARPAFQRAIAKTFPPHVIEEARRNAEAAERATKG